MLTKKYKKMKKTYNINISGYGFVIDEDAFQILDSYLTTLSEICGKAGEGEIAADIEQRIAEILIEKIDSSGQNIITRADVEEVIGRMGSPEDIIDLEVSAHDSSTSSSTTPPPFVSQIPFKKKLYRDLDDKVIGGVCSGLGWYFGIDPVWIRIIAVAGVFISVSWLLWLYVILWIVIPAAKTPFQRMQMMGVDPSMRNVGKVVTGQYAPSGQPSSFCPANNPAERREGAGQLILKIISILGLVVVGSLMIAMGVAFVGCILALCISSVAHNNVDTMQVRLVLGCIAGGAVIMGIPLFLLFRILLSVSINRKLPAFPLSLNISLLVFWLIGIGAVITCGILLQDLYSVGKGLNVLMSI